MTRALSGPGPAAVLTVLHSEGPINALNRQSRRPTNDFETVILGNRSPPKRNPDFPKAVAASSSAHLLTLSSALAFCPRWHRARSRSSRRGLHLAPISRLELLHDLPWPGSGGHLLLFSGADVVLPQDEGSSKPLAGPAASTLQGMEQLLQHIGNFMHDLELWIHQQPAEKLYAALAVLLLTFAVLLLGPFFKRKKSNTIVLSGLSGSGKTVLFHQLRDGSSHQGSVTSMESNDDCFVLHSESERKNKIKPVRVVDIPGHSRLRAKLDDFLQQAAGIVFVVDALDFLPNCQTVAEYLYDILTKASVVKKRTPVLILCNKTDKVTAHTKDFIRKQLEKDVDKLRTSRAAISTADVTSEHTLGVPGEKFAFSQCQNKVSVAEASGLAGEITQLEQFIREHVKPY
ncbi:hypothetical protein Taro_036114 [Colocasia esculenta]|uniref:Signal recognition particle receptor subunit beta n=1 Tax=Colocasia esculenta TaxID=4460 RepID=A0A843WKP0_COLES|nr:hypothetical protein [Colocasia esculenta]